MNRDEIILLFDIYGSLLTENMQNCIDYYYNDDLSLAEIASNLGITRQGVRDTINRGVKLLKHYDEKLKLNSHFDELNAALIEILQLSEDIKKINMDTALNRKINDAATRINTLAHMLSD